MNDPETGTKLLADSAAGKQARHMSGSPEFYELFMRALDDRAKQPVEKVGKFGPIGSI